ncbi:MAG: hypothetical protein ACHQF2_00150 [Flavobacteriales bacterium]
MKSSFLVLLSISLFFVSSAQTSDSLKKQQRGFELSFGQSVLFISHSKLVDIRNQSATIIPTNSILFLSEFRTKKFLRVPVFFNIPTESKQFLVNGQLINERASPTFGAGIQLRCFKFGFFAKSKIEFEAGAMASFLLSKNNDVIFAPVLAGRLRVSKGENFVMYVGASYSIGINSWGLLYGTGTVFSP